MQKLIFNPLDSANVLVVGDIILDQYIYGETNRISPEAPVPVVQVTETEERPGGAANVAMNIASLGLSVQLLGITGKDEASLQLENILNNSGVECHFIRRAIFPTITKRRILSQDQQLIRLDYENAVKQPQTTELVECYIQLLDSSDVIILSDYAKGSLNQIQTLIETARQKNIPVLVDPKSNDFNAYHHASVLTPNQKEFEMIVGSCQSNADLLTKGNKLCGSLKLDALLITRGKNGMTLLRTDMAPLHLKAVAHEVYDVTGAGDTVIAVLAAAIACHYNIEQAIEFANTAASLVVEKLGTVTVTIEDINNAISKRYSNLGVIDANTALKIIRQAKQNGKKIIMTNGCFDILHAGHVHYLSKARLLGDKLIVAVNDDASVARLKGPSRPLNSMQHRTTVLSALASVDLVVSFSEDTPENLISFFQPDILVKGGDYTEEQVTGAAFVRDNGGDVVILPYEEGCSTTLMFEKMATSTRELS